MDVNTVLVNTECDVGMPALGCSGTSRLRLKYSRMVGDGKPTSMHPGVYSGGDVCTL